MIPFFVVDRKSHIQFFINNYADLLKEGKIGFMAHANLTRPTMELLSEVDVKYKFCDSGAFAKNKKKKSNQELLGIYHKYKITDGIMMDVLKDKDKTVQKAYSILKLYKQNNYKFNLWGVAQGKTVEEYMDCYLRLKNMGYIYIAIGGMIIINEKSPYPKVDEGLLYSVLNGIAGKYPQDNSFALGVLGNKRYLALSTFNIFGADSGQWRFKYNNDNKSGSVYEAKKRKFQERKQWIDNKMIPMLKRTQTSVNEFF